MSQLFGALKRNRGASPSPEHVEQTARADAGPAKRGRGRQRRPRREGRRPARTGEGVAALRAVGRERPGDRALSELPRKRRRRARVARPRRPRPPRRARAHALRISSAGSRLPRAIQQEGQEGQEIRRSSCTTRRRNPCASLRNVSHWRCRAARGSRSEDLRDHKQPGLSSACDLSDPHSCRRRPQGRLAANCPGLLQLQSVETLRRCPSGPSWPPCLLTSLPPVAFRDRRTALEERTQPRSQWTKMPSYGRNR
jgi:hypothetical protein